MLYYLCTCCGNVFSGETIKIDDEYYMMSCPISSCCGEIFEIDEEMIIPIKTLNDKGYITRFCCSGHLYGTPGEGYVSFCEDTVPKAAPRGWVIDGNAIRYKYSDNASDVKKLKERHKKIESLIEWCDKLKPIGY